MTLESEIDSILLNQDLSIQQSKNAFRGLFRHRQHNSDFGMKILALLQKKGIHSNEIVGLIRVIHELEKPIAGFEPIPYLVDGCGTGGDGAQTINISTLACLVAAAGGAYVAKHGNRSISSKCGSADLLESLGVKIDASQAKMLRALKICRIGYFHAPLYHPIFQKVQMIRRELARKKIKTIFNLIGPLVNPLRPERQVVGVFQKDLTLLLARVVKKLGWKHAIIVWNHDGLDEITTTRRSLAIELKEGIITRKTLNPKVFGFKLGKRSELKGGTVSYNCRIAKKILSGRDKGTRNNTIVFTAAVLLYVSGQAENIRQGIKIARKALGSGSALFTLKQLVVLSHGIS